MLPSQTLQHEPRTLGDDRGAIMLIALFFAIFGVAILYLAIGASESVLFREHLQDAADSAALSGAVAHARMMNLLVLINIVAAALLAILVALKTVETLAIAGMAIAAALAFVTFGASLAAIPPLEGIRRSMQSAYDTTQKIVLPVLKMMKTLGDTLAVAAPEISLAIVQSDIGARKADGTVTDGIATTTLYDPTGGDGQAFGLPVANDQYSMLCGKAGALAVMIAMKPFEELGVPGKVTSVLSDGLESLTKSLSSWFCDDEANEIPSLPMDLDIGFPRDNPEKNAAQSACTSSVASIGPGELKQRMVDKDKNPITPTSECARFNDYNNSVKPDAAGNCTPMSGQSNCTTGGAFENMAASARGECDPSKLSGLTNYVYQLQQMRVVYRWDGKIWIRGKPELIPQDEVESGQNSALVQGVDGGKLAAPCGPGKIGPTVAEGYNLKMHPDDDPSVFLPVCSTEVTPDDPIPQYTTDKQGNEIQLPVEPVTITYKQVTNIFSCERRETKKLQAENSTSPAAEGKDDKAPKRIKDKTAMGSESFQVRGFVLANQRQRESEQLVRLGQWGAPDPASPYEPLRKLSGYAFAQAEYFYEYNGDQEELGGKAPETWMWNMCWRARLKRFAMPTDSSLGRKMSLLCSALKSDDCEWIIDTVSDWDGLIIH